MNVTSITERPWINSERTVATPFAPLITFSSGRVTKASTCSGERPGASVWTLACAGTKSGNTS
jgi:hypothetical protein